MDLIKLINHTIGMLSICASSTSFAVDSITFASGAPLDDYQAKVIIPILTEAFKKHNIEFSAKQMPSLRSLQVSNSGELDGELHRVSNFHEITNNQYNNLLRIDSKLLSVHLIVFAKENFLINSTEDIQNYSLAYYRGRKDVDQLLSQQTTQKSIYRVNTDIQAFQMLAADRVDLVITESHLGNSIINSNTEFNNIKELKHLAKTDIHSYIHKKHQKLLPIINKTLELMEANGRFEEIINTTSFE